MFTSEHDILMYFKNGIKKAFESVVGGNGERGSADGHVRNFKATGVDLSQLPMTPANVSIDAPRVEGSMIDSKEFEVIDDDDDDDDDDEDGEQHGEGVVALPMPPIKVKEEEEPKRFSADAPAQQQQQQQQTDLQAFGFTREAVPATQRRNVAMIDKIAAEIAAVENTEAKFQSLPETYKERTVALPSDSDGDRNDDDDMKDEDFDPFAMKATMAVKIASKKRKVIETDAAETKETEMDNDTDGEKENNFEHRNGRQQQQRQHQQQSLTVEFDLDAVRAKRAKRAERAKLSALEREKKASADAELLKEASLENQDNAAATNALIRRFDKSEFGNLRVVGQFNRLHHRRSRQNRYIHRRSTR